MDNKISSTLIPAVFKESLKKADLVPSSNKEESKASEFEKILKEDVLLATDSNELKISAHAMKRINERKLEMDSQEFIKLRDAISKLKNKGGRDSLVITDKAAYIVDVEKNTVVTAIDKSSLAENIFTKIDSTFIVD